MPSPTQRATKLFVRTFGTSPDACFQAPGRINLMGEHTDYNEGFVLPAAVNFRVLVAVKHREDNLFRVVTDIDSEDFVEWTFGQEDLESKEFHWSHYLKSFTAALAMSGLESTGVDVAIISDIPVEHGFSSSAALQIAFGTAVNDASHLFLSPLAIAQLAQRGEHQFMARTCGMKDQMISALAESNQALLIDCLDLDYEAVTIPDSLSLIIVHSGKYAQDVQRKFQLRKNECQQVAEYFGLESLRHISESQLKQHQNQLAEHLYNRARHVITENARTQNAARALKQGNVKKLSQLMAQSHQSMRDDFAMSIPEIDLLVDIIQQQVGDRGGVRLTGSGFGGSVVALVEHELTDDVVTAVETQYLSQTGIEAQVYLCSAAEAAAKVAE
ncbi:galactokinase [Parashewanella curva]|uniref:Galactokinase n=1 Tax=Parashewanella curva TaxID=2338552 RepID=A0A3L8PYZ8_9GAMM|nr:galactokinase [Parashewanella curva]RLV60591.1 galactokinase [Parashewanella curva]